MGRFDFALQAVWLTLAGMVALVILIVFGLLMLAAIVRLLWRAVRGDIQIEPSSHGRQLFGRSEKDRDT